MSRRVVIGVDPGNTESAFTVVEVDNRRPILIGKLPNDEVLRILCVQAPYADRVGIEMVASYGMAVGKDVFETCVWIGRFQQAIADEAPEISVDLIYRRDVKLHHCGSAKAKDPNITQALIDRFASGEPNRGKGTKAEPGWFHGFRDDIWQAHALTVLVADQEAAR